MSQSDEKVQDMTVEEMKAEIKSLVSKVACLQVDKFVQQMKFDAIISNLFERIAKADPVVRTGMAQIFTEMGIPSAGVDLEAAAQELNEQKST